MFMGCWVYVCGEISDLRCKDMGRQVYVCGAYGVQIWGGLFLLLTI